MRKRLCLSAEEYAYETAGHPIEYTPETYWEQLPAYIKSWYSQAFASSPYVEVKDPLDYV